MTSGFFLHRASIIIQELLFLMVLVNLIFVSIKCNTIENTLFHSEQIGAAAAKSPQTSSSYDKKHYCSTRKITQLTPTLVPLILNILSVVAYADYRL